MSAKFVHQSFRCFLALCVAVLLTASTLSVLSTTEQSDVSVESPASLQLASGPKDGFCG